jgi:hypothetical protein
MHNNPRFKIWQMQNLLPNTINTSALQSTKYETFNYEIALKEIELIKSEISVFKENLQNLPNAHSSFLYHLSSLLKEERPPQRALYVVPQSKAS